MKNKNQSVYKIYSRNRLDIFKIKKNNKTHYFEMVFIIFIIVIITCVVIFKSIDPIFENICEDEARAIATKIINIQTSKEMQNYTYDDLFNIQRDENGNIQMINANIFVIDSITSNIANSIQNELEKTRVSNVKISLGSLSGIKILAGSGPTISIKISSAGKVDTDLKSEFISKGINQTLHRIYFQIDCQISILTPFETIKQNISNKVLLAENIIIGQIPSTYYTIDTDDSDEESLIDNILPN